jgi:hypothetical protein
MRGSVVPAARDGNRARALVYSPPVRPRPIALWTLVALSACSLDALACASACQGRCPIPIAVRVQRSGGAPFDGTTYVIEVQSDTEGEIVTCTGPSPSALSCDQGAEVEGNAIFVGFSTTPASLVVTVRDGTGSELARQTFAPVYTQGQVCSTTCEVADDQVVTIP